MKGNGTKQRKCINNRKIPLIGNNKHGYAKLNVPHKILYTPPHLKRIEKQIFILQQKNYLILLSKRCLMMYPPKRSTC